MTSFLYLLTTLGLPYYSHVISQAIGVMFSVGVCATPPSMYSSHLANLLSPEWLKLITRNTQASTTRGRANYEMMFH